MTTRIHQAHRVIPLSEDVPEWVHLIPAGTFSGRDGRGPYVLGPMEAQAVLDNFAALGMPMVVDYEHQTYNALDNGQAAPAAAWIDKIESREDGIWGHVEWTERSASMIRSKEYRYLSPVFNHTTDGRIFQLLNAGLTNNPNLYLTAVATRCAANPMETPSVNYRESLLYMLNLPVTTTDDELKVHLERVLAELETSQNALASLSEGLGVDAKVGLTDPAALMTAVNTLKSAGSPDPSRFVPLADFERVSHQLQQIQQAQQSEQVDAAVKGAVTAGKVAPAMEGWAREYASRDLGGFRKYLETAPVIVPTQGTPDPGPGAQTDRHSLDINKIYHDRKPRK